MKNENARPERAIYILAISSVVNYPRFEPLTANTRVYSKIKEPTKSL
jgi:hypothetical protein